MRTILRHGVNVVLVMYLFVAMSAHKCLAFSSELHSLEGSSGVQQKDGKAGENVTESSGLAEVHSAWPSVLGALTAVFSTGLLIALAVRYRFFRWCMVRTNHALLPEVETESYAEAFEEEIPVRGMRGRMVHPGESSDDEENNDDDGFIEDNYITASVREKAEVEENMQDEVEDSDDELILEDIIEID